MKIARAEYERFIAEALPGDWCIDSGDCPEFDDPDHGSVIEVSDGIRVDWQGKGSPPANAFILRNDIIECMNGVVEIDVGLLTVFRRWRKAQSHVRVSVELRKDELAGLKAYLKAHGGKVIG